MKKNKEYPIYFEGKPTGLRLIDNSEEYDKKRKKCIKSLKEILEKEEDTEEGGVGIFKEKLLNLGEMLEGLIDALENEEEK